MAEIVNICDVCTEIFAGGDAPKGRVSKERTEEYPIPIYSNGEEKAGLYGFTDVARVEKPSVTVSARGTIGYTAIRTEPFVPIVRLITLVPDQNIIDINYLYYAVQNYEFEGSGTSIPQLTVPMLKKYNFPLPSKEEQQKVASALDKVNELLALRKEQLAKLDQLVKSRFVELFGDPKSNERGWKTLPLHRTLESGSSVSYGIVQTGDDVEGGVPVFRPVDIAGGKIPTRDRLKRTTIDISNQYSRTLLKGCELLITVRGSVGETFRINSDFAGCNVGRNIVPLRFDTSLVDYSFMQFFFAQDGTKRVLESMTKGIALQGLNMSEFREIDVIIPDMNLQQKFAAFVEQTDKSKLAIQQSLDKLELLKKSLMQEYFG